MSAVPVTLVGGTAGLPHGLQPCSSNFLPNHVAWPRYTLNVNSLGLLFCTILFPGHISGLFSQGQDMSLPGTKQKSGVDAGYPAESAVRCDKLIANLTRRCCQAGRGGSCSTRDSLSLLRTLMWHGNLFQASLRQCLRALISPERWGMDGGGAETSCQWGPMGLSQQRGSVNDCSQGWLSHHRRWKSMLATYGLKSKISSLKAFSPPKSCYVFFSERMLDYTLSGY